MNTVYARYNRHRLPAFQVETSIRIEDRTQTVVKRALLPDAERHIQDMLAGHARIEAQLRPGTILLPSIVHADNVSIGFQYIRGRTIDEELFRCFRRRDKAAFMAGVDGYMALLERAFDCRESCPASPQVVEVFGDCCARGFAGCGPCLPVAAVDAVFENIVLSEGSAWLVDNEWVFEGAIPAGFVAYRSIFYFHRVKHFETGLAEFIRFDELLNQCKISREQAELYRAMDESFQAHVFGPTRCYAYRSNYLKRRVSVHELEQTIEHQRAVLRKYHAAILNNERVIAEIVNSAGWRAWRKAAGLIDCVCPPGSIRRRAADRLIGALKARGR